jgi:hypothetical protein
LRLEQSGNAGPGISGGAGLPGANVALVQAWSADNAAGAPRSVERKRRRVGFSLFVIF